MGKFMFRADRNHLPRSKHRREGTSRWSIYCITTIISNQIKKQKIMDNEKRKNNVKGNRRERANKGGRPVKGATEKLKYRVTVKMATEDYYLLKSKAKSAGVSASEFIRGCIFSLYDRSNNGGVSASEFIRGCITEGGVKERISKEHGELIRKLCGMANNLNQLARKANAEGYASVFVTCRTLMIEIDNLVNRIRL